MAGEVRVVYRKHDGSLHWHLMTQWLGEDEHGIWTGAPRPTLMRKGDGPLVTLEYASVMLFPRERLVDRRLQRPARGDRDLLRHHHAGAVAEPW